MSERIHVDRDRPPARLPARLLNEMRSHALETLPEECCGLVLGSDGARYQEVHRCRNEMTMLHLQDPVTFPRDGQHAFQMNPGDCARIQRDADAASLHVTGVYHSHIEAEAYFSAMDQLYASQRHFPFPGADHFVISVVDGGVREVAVFRPDAAAPAGRAFAGRRVEAAAP